jgi:small-conductance mechanosensitive channel/CRP-like cAMP-binding protein
MTLLLSLLAIGALLGLQRVCRDRNLTPPPLRMPLIAAIAIPVLTLIVAILEKSKLALLSQSLQTAISLLWVYSIIRLLSWTILQLPSELGWWKPTAKILRDLVTLAIATTITLLVIHRDFQVNLVGLAATSAVLTAVIGLAAQETLKNLFAGISLQVDSPFEEGDWIDLGFTRGVVTSLRLMTTRIHTLEGSLAVIPNSRIAVESLRRFKPGDPVGQIVEVGLDYSLPPRQAIDLLQTIVERNRKVLKEPTPKVWLDTFADSAINYRLLTWQNSTQEQLQLKSDLLEQIWYALQRIGQSIPYPIRDIRSEPSPALLPSHTVSDEEKQQLLASLEIFSHLTADQLQRLAAEGRCQSFAPGEVVVREGERGHSLFVIVSGSLDVLQGESKDQAHRITSLTRSDVFGEMALCTGEPRAATVICNDECVLLEIERRHLIPLMEEHPKILETIATLMATRRKELRALSKRRSETRRRALIGRMQRLFNLASDAL